MKDKKILIVIGLALIAIILFVAVDRMDFTSKGKEFSLEETVYKYAENEMKAAIKNLSTRDGVINKRAMKSKLVKPEKILEFDDIKEGSKYSLWNFDYKLKVKGFLHDLEKEAYGFEDGWITRPYKYKRAYIIVEEDAYSVSIHGLFYKSDGEIEDSELCKKKLRNFLEIKGRIPKYSEEDEEKIEEIIRNVKLSDEYLKKEFGDLAVKDENVHNTAVDGAKEEIAETILRLNKESQNIKEARIDDIEGMNLGHASNESSELLYNVKFAMITDNGIEMHEEAYVVQIVNAWDDYIAFTCSAKELEKMLAEVEGAQTEEDKWHEVLSKLVEEYTY